MEKLTPMTIESVTAILKEAGAQIMARSGRSEHYGAPRDFSFEVKGAFTNGMGVHVVARQFNYREAWEAEGRVNDLVDVSLLRDGAYAELPRGYAYFQGTDMEEGLQEAQLRELIISVCGLNPKIYLLQELTGGN